MLETNKGPRKKHKTNIVLIENQNSHTELNDENKNAINRKRKITKKFKFR